MRRISQDFGLDNAARNEPHHPIRKSTGPEWGDSRRAQEKAQDKQEDDRRPRQYPKRDVAISRRARARGSSYEREPRDNSEDDNPKSPIGDGGGNPESLTCKAGGAGSRRPASQPNPSARPVSDGCPTCGACGSSSGWLPTQMALSLRPSPLGNERHDSVAVRQISVRAWTPRMSLWVSSFRLSRDYVDFRSHELLDGFANGCDELSCPRPVPVSRRQ